MTFDDEETQTKFHALKTQTQYDFVNFEEFLATMGYVLHIAKAEDGELEMRVRIDKESKRSTLYR